jgi:Zn-dependent protease
VLAILFGLVYRFLISSGTIASYSSFVVIFFHFSILINLGLSFFNLIPIPPLDGSNILMGLLPTEKIGSYLKFIRHAPKILLGLLLAEWVFHLPVFSTIINPFWIPYMNFWQFIILGGKVI